MQKGLYGVLKHLDNLCDRALSKAILEAPPNKRVFEDHFSIFGKMCKDSDSDHWREGGKKDRTYEINERK